MNDEIDHIADLVASRIREELGLPAPAAKTCPDGCSSCGHCANKRADDVRAIVGSGAARVGAAPGTGQVATDLAAMIDHTLLKPDATPDQIAQLCFEARKHGFASVCVNPGWVPLCAQLLQGSPVKVCTVIGFPLGATAPEVKAFETQNAIDHGATEIDMVLNIGALKARDLDLVARDIRGVVQTAHARGPIVKVILETALLTDEEKTIACLIAKEAGADFVKTSTGFSGGGATVQDIALMRRVVGPEMGVKASGGVRTFEDAESMIKAGATRIGASAGVKIIQGPSAEKPAAAPAAPAKSY